MQDPWVMTSMALLCMFYCQHGVAATPLSGGSKCGFPQVQNVFDHSLRIVGGQGAEYGSHPWMVSLRSRGSHFCGASILTDQWILSAAHCFSTVSKRFLKSVVVVIGEYDRTVADAGEQTFALKSVKVHENYHHSNPMSYDIVLLELNGQIRFGRYVQPICLPLPDEDFIPGTTCVVSGWGQMKERGHLPAILREVQLDLVEQAKCKYTIQTVKPGQKTFTVVCAGPEKGGKDACQGDSGSPLICPREEGHWAVVGVTSWGKGCGRSWINNRSKPPWKRGSPGVFTNVQMFLPWIKETLREVTQPNRKSASKMPFALLGKFVLAHPPPSLWGGQPNGASDQGSQPEPEWLRRFLNRIRDRQLALAKHQSKRLCSASDGLQTGIGGLVQNPDHPGHSYKNNEMCLWSIHVPSGKSIMLDFLEFDVENNTHCASDQLAVFAGTDRLIGRFCGSRLPSPILVGSSSATIQFLSDFSVSGAGFSIKFDAVEPHSILDSGCGTVAVLQAEGIVQSPHYPDLYGNNSDCHWIIHAPSGHVVKLEFNDFDVEPSEECVYDSLVAFGDVEGKEEIAVLCGRTLPPPVLSYESVMVLRFASDSTVSHRGFNSIVSFINEEGLCGMRHVSGSSALSRVVGGEEAEPHSWPWQASLGLATQHVCGGAVVRPSWILTAAHCLYGLAGKYSNVLSVVAGDHDLSTRDPEEQTRAVRRIIFHPGYNDSSLDYDVALVQLDAPLSFNDRVQPVCLPSARQEVPPSHVCTASGWGDQTGGRSNRTLQQLELPILEHVECEQYYPGRLTSTMFCAGFPLSEGKDTCLGDSGGALVCQSEDSSYFVYGVTSWGQGCGRFQRPGVYTSVPLLKDWILEQLGEFAEKL